MDLGQLEKNLMAIISSSKTFSTTEDLVRIEEMCKKYSIFTQTLYRRSCWYKKFFKEVKLTFKLINLSYLGKGKLRDCLYWGSAPMGHQCREQGNFLAKRSRN